MAKSFKKKQKLPKFDGGSMYDEQQPMTSNTNMLGGGTEFKAVGNSQFYNNKLYSEPTVTSTSVNETPSNFSKNSGMYGQMISGGANSMTNQQNTKYTDSSNQQNASLEETSGKFLPWMQVATSLRNMGQSSLQRDEAGNIKGGGSKAANEWMTADHTHMLREAKKGDAAGVLRESSSMGKIGRSISQLANKDEETSGKWGKFNKLVGMEKKKVLEDPNAAYEQQMNATETQRKLQYGTYAQGGRIYDSGNGIPNAEIEKQEVTGYTQGGIEAHDLNTHENATADNQISLQKGDMILSDKIKDPLNKNKTFAKVGKPYDTKKEESILNDVKASNLSKKTAELNFMSKKTLFQQTFERQEQLKADKVRKYANKLGVNLGAPQQGNLGIVPEFAYGGGYGDPPSNYSSWRREKEKLGWQQSPLVDPKSSTPDMYDPSAFKFSKVEDPNALGVNDHVWEGYDKTKYKYEGLKPDALDAYGYKNSNYYGNFTPTTKPIAPIGSTKTGWQPAGDPKNPSHYMKIGDTNPNARYQYMQGSYMPVHKYGGIQKFAPGGRMYDWDMPVGGPLDKAILRDKNQSYKSDKTDYNYDPTAPTKSIYDQESDPNGGSANWDDMNSPEFKKENQEMLARAQDAARSEQGKSNNWKEGAYQGVTGLASNMGELFAMYKASKPVEVQQRYDYKPEVLNNTAADRAAWKMYKTTADSLKNAGLSGGQYASNLGANRASLTEQLDTQRINRENINTGIRNDAQVRNIAGRYSVDDINARNRAAKENLQLKATERMGTNIAQQSKDYRATQQEKDMLPFMQKAFSDPAFQKMFAEWMATQGKKSK